MANIALHMIERDLPPHHQDFIGFMEQAVPEVLRISLDEIVDTYDFRQRVAELEAFRDGMDDSDKLAKEDKWRYSMAKSAQFIVGEEDDDKADKKQDKSYKDTMPSAYNTVLSEEFSKLFVEKLAESLPEKLLRLQMLGRGLLTKKEWIYWSLYLNDSSLRSGRRRHPDHVDLEDDYGNDIYDVSAAHPDNLVNWPDNERTNCLGISLMMVGFAHRAGARIFIHQYN
jgi:hypothetical protein